MTHTGKVITVFGSARVRDGEPDYQEARLLGRELAARGFAVCTGGYGGVMAAASRGAKEAGGETIAVTAKYFGGKANEWIDREHAVDGWEERLFELIRLGDGFVACKGGTGTLAELAVLWEMLNKRIVTGKPCVTLGEFWTPVVSRVREVETAHDSRWAEATAGLIEAAPDAQAAAELLARILGSQTR